jgi:hypothetical protein
VTTTTRREGVNGAISLDWAKRTHLFGRAAAPERHPLAQRRPDDVLANLAGNHV